MIQLFNDIMKDYVESWRIKKLLNYTIGKTDDSDKKSKNLKHSNIHALVAKKQHIDKY